MKNNQYKPIEKIYMVQELKQPNQTPLISEKQWQAPVRKSLLSKAARGKIVNRSSSYQSLQGQESYGPCVPYNDNCECSAEQLRRQVQDLENWFNREREVHQATLQRMGPLIDQRNELQEQVNILTQESGQVRQELQTERINHQQTRNDLEASRNLINTAQNALGIDDLTQLPTMPEGQSLQSLVDFYNEVTPNWRQRITDVEQERDNRPTVDDYNNLRNEKNNLERELDFYRNQNRVLENERDGWRRHVCYVPPPSTPTFIKKSIIFRCGECKISYSPYYWTCIVCGHTLRDIELEEN